MKRPVFFYAFILILAVALGVVGYKFVKQKNLPPLQELFTQAEKLRAGGAVLDAAVQYDLFWDGYPKSELAPQALYYAGTCKFLVGVNCPGIKEFDQKKAGLADAKKKEYQACLDYLKSQKKAFAYDDKIDKYLYQGTEFEKLIKDYPASDLVDDAAFQLVRTKIAAQQQQKTLNAGGMLQQYAEFFQKYPQSPFRKDGVEDLSKLVAEAPDPLPDHKALVASYQKLAPAAKDFPELGKLAYVLGKKLLKEGDPANAAAIFGVPALLGIGVVETQQTRLNIRGGPDTAQKVVTKANKGEEVLILEKTGQWYRIQLQDGVTGYARNDFIKVNPK